MPHELQCARGIKRSNYQIAAQIFCPTVDWPLPWCRQEGVEGGSGPDQDQEQQAEEVEGGQGGEGRGRQGGAEEQGEHWQDGKVRSRSDRWVELQFFIPHSLLTLPGAASLERRRSGPSSLARSSSHSPSTDWSLRMETLVRWGESSWTSRSCFVISSKAFKCSLNPVAIKSQAILQDAPKPLEAKAHLQVSTDRALSLSRVEH